METKLTQSDLDSGKLIQINKKQVVLLSIYIMYGCVVRILVGHFLLVIRVLLSLEWLYEFQKPTMLATECTLAFCHEVLQSFQLFLSIEVSFHFLCCNMAP